MVELGETERNVQRMCRRGDFPGAFRTGKVRGHWKIPRSGLDAYVEHRQRETERARPRRRG